MRNSFRTLLAAFVAVSMVAFVGCGKDDSNNASNGSGSGNGIVNPIPNPTPGPGPNPQPTINWVDLGLPSGLLWAECNLGASSPEEYGDYIAWGEIQPKSVYEWGTYCYCTSDSVGNLITLTKYNTSTDYGTVDSLTTLQPSDDAATARLGSGARTPTREEWQELVDNTTIEWTSQNGVNGRKVTGANGKSLFLPATGYRSGYNSGTDVIFAGDGGGYLSASLYIDDPYFAWNFNYDSAAMNIRSASRYDGHSVRAVRSR